jgi:hypothetical protein
MPQHDFLRKQTVDVAAGTPAGPHASHCHDPAGHTTPVLFRFSHGAALRAEHWEVLEKGRPSLCSSDNHSCCGVPAPIDIIDELRELLRGREVGEVREDASTGTLSVSFDGEIELRMLVAE